MTTPSDDVQDRTRTALVIGGGIAGPATAMALQKAGIEATVYEAHQSGAGGIGAFLTLASNGIDALRVLDADRAALTAGFATPAITLRSGNGKLLGQTRTGLTPPDGTASHTTKRADLYSALHDDALERGIRIEAGKRLVSAREESGQIRAVFADGSDAGGDVLLGCDGIHSTVRSLIDPAAPAPTYSGLLTTGGYARGVRVDAEPGSYEMIFGEKAFFGYVAAPGGEVWWFANLPERAEPAPGVLAAVSEHEWRARLIDLYAADAGPAVQLIEASPQIAPVSPIHTMGRLPRWHTDRMVVIGDAAHAPSPTSGQGASLAIEDAVVVAICLRDHATPRAAFSAFDSGRRARVERIVKWAARINNNKVAGPVGRVLRDAMLPPILKLTADNKALRQTFDYHIDWDDLAPGSGPVPR